MTLDALAERAAVRFANQFGRPPRWIAAAPGRVNLIGEHTDYNNGFVLPMAIERHTVVAADWNGTDKTALHSVTAQGAANIDMRGAMKPGEPAWSNYVRGVISGFQALGAKVGGFDAVIDSTVPLGSGLSSSAALEVGTATALEAMTEHRLDPVEKALLCQRAEHEFAGVPCGIMDQFTSVMARKKHLLLLDCQTRAVTWVPLENAALSVMIINTNVRHNLAEREYAERRAQCEAAARQLSVTSLREVSVESLEVSRKQLDPVTFRRAHHVVSEIERTLLAAKALQKSDWSTVGELMYRSHISLRDDFEVSCLELDAVAAIARSIGVSGGVLGCRMTGGGFGGCAVALINAAAESQIARQIGESYERRTGTQATIFCSRAADGSRLLA